MGNRGGTLESAWMDMVDQYFPKSEEKLDQYDLSIGDITKYTEHKVDSMKKQKE